MFSYLFHQKVTVQLQQALLPRAPSAGWMKLAEYPRGPSRPCPEAGLAQGPAPRAPYLHLPGSGKLSHEHRGPLSKPQCRAGPGFLTLL